MSLQLLCENQKGCSNSQCCQLCTATKPPAWKIINQLVYDFLNLTGAFLGLFDKSLVINTVPTVCKSNFWFFSCFFSTLYLLFRHPLRCFTYITVPLSLLFFGPSCLNLSFLFCLLFLPPLSLSFSDGPDLLEGHRAYRHGANRVSGRPAVPVPAQHHHCGLHSLPGCHVLHHLSAHLLSSPLHPQLGRWRTPLQVRCYDFIYFLRTVDISPSFSLFIL